MSPLTAAKPIASTPITDIAIRDVVSGRVARRIWARKVDQFARNFN